MQKAVLFDFAGVCTATHESSVSIRQIERDLGLVDGELIPLLFHNEAWRSAQVGKITDEEFWGTVLRPLGFSTGESISQFKERHFAGQQIRAGMMPLLQQLRRVLRTALVTNGTHALRHVVLKRKFDIEYLFDEIVISAEVGVAKPDQRIYRVAASRLGVSPDDCVFVDDWQDNVRGATIAGMQGIVFSSVGQLAADLEERVGVSLLSSVIEKVDITDVVGRHVSLKVSGKSRKGRCPFHDGEGQTLTVWPGTQTFYCFNPACRVRQLSEEVGRLLDVFDFVMLKHNVSYRDAVRLVGELVATARQTTQPRMIMPDASSLERTPSEPIGEASALPARESAHGHSVFSDSMLETFQLCPMRFKRRYIDGQSGDENVYQWRLGLSVHHALSAFLKAKPASRTISRLHELLDEKWQSYGYDDDEHETYWRERTHQMLEDFFHTDGSLGNPVLIERHFDFALGDYMISGSIDRIDQVGPREFEVIDYKVLGTPMDHSEAGTNLQSVCYYYGTMHLTHDPPVRMTYLYLDAGEKVSFEPDRELMEEALAAIRDLIQEIRETSSFAASKNKYCFNCPLNGLCPKTAAEPESKRKGR